MGANADHELSPREVKRLLRAAHTRFAGIPGIVELSYGRKCSRWKIRSSPALVIGVESKRRLRGLPKSHRIPKFFRGVATDVVEVGEIVDLTCRIPHPSAEPPLPHRPGIWIGPPGNCNWGSVAIFVQDEVGRVFALTARHALRAPETQLLGSTVEIESSSEGLGGRSNAIEGRVVKHTDINPEHYDVAMVELRGPRANRVANRTYGRGTRITGIAPAAAGMDLSVILHGSRTALADATRGEVITSGVISANERGLPGGRTWIRFRLPAAEGDSGGLIAAEQDAKALAVLQFGRRLDQSNKLFYHVYGTPLEEAVRDLSGSSSLVKVLPGYEDLKLTLV